MKLLVVAGPPSSGKTSLIKQVIKNFKDHIKIAFLKIDVVKAFEDIELAEEFGIATKKIYSGDLCPDHAEVMVLQDALEWAEEIDSDLLIIESAGLCLRCSPYLNQGIGVAVISSISGIHTPEKMGPMISLSDVVIITKIDLVSQAEREVFSQKIKEVHENSSIIETNTLQGTSLHRLYEILKNCPDIEKDNLELRGNPPLGTCTVCIGNKKIGWQKHFGVIRKLDGSIADYIYRGE